MLLSLVLVAFETRSQPRLEVVEGPLPEVILQWSAAETGYALEFASGLGSAAVWQMVDAPAELRGGQWRVITRATAGQRFFRLRQATPALTRITASSPFPGESGVAVTRETILHASAPLGPGVSLSADEFFAEFAGRRLLTRSEISSDRRTLTLFMLENLPAAALARVTLDADRVLDAAGNALDADGDGRPGGILVLEFETAGITGLSNTAVVGQVFASEKNADGTSRPLSNVTVTVDGAEETLRATTDASGRFRLQPSPSGRFFVHVDGRTAEGSQWPDGAYYPIVGKAWEAVAGGTNNLAGGSGEVYLPLIQSDALRAVSSVETTRITFGASVLAADPSLAGVEISVPPNALFADNGTRGGRMGIAPVPPDRLPEPLPPGLEMPLVITVQTDGAANFDTPVPVKFPNLPDPRTGVRLGPGEKTVLWSFNHDTGRWEAQGTATISADGLFAVSDPGVGIRQPGWHGVMPGSPGAGPRQPGGPGGGSPPPCVGPDCECTQVIICPIRHEGRHYAICALSCLGNIWDRFFDKNKTPRAPVEDGLRCIGGPDKCPGTPEDVLTKKQRDCVDGCRYPDTDFVRYTMPCEGFEHPCLSPATALQPGLHSEGRAVDTPDALPSSLAPGFIPIADRLEEQFYIWAVEEEYLLRFTGTPKFVQTEVEEIPLLNLFLDLFSTYVGPGSQAGIHLSAGERSELLTLPRPSQFTALEWQALIDRMDSLQGAPLPAEVAVAKARLDSAVALLVSRGWKRRLDGLIDGFIRLSLARAPELGSAEFPARAHYFYLRNHDNGFVQRGRLSTTGTFEGLILAPESHYSVVYYDPVTRFAGGAFFRSGVAGEVTEVPTALLEPLPADQTDRDFDLVPDVMEKVLGTNPEGADSDGDGASDGAELAAGTNPLDGIPVAIGVRMVLDTPGDAVDVVAWNDLVAVADGIAGVALLDASDPATPVRLAQLAVPGSATAVAGAGALLAAAGPSGVSIFDVSSPATPVLLARRTWGVQAQGVAVANGRVLAGLASGEIVLLDSLGEILQRLRIGTRPIQDMLVRDSVVYVLEVSRLHLFTLEDGTLTSRGSLAVPGETAGVELDARLRLSCDGEHLFLTHAVGFAVFDLADPLLPVLKRDVPTLQAGWKQFVSDGSGVGLGAVNANSTFAGPHDVSLYDVGLDRTNAVLQTTFPTPGLAWAVSLHEGMAYVADGAAGLTVISYAAPDLFGKAPTIALTAALRPGPTSQMSREPLRLVATAQDDVRVRSVEFLVDGERVAKFAAPPYALQLRAPTLSAGKTSFTIQARATDSGGNTTLTPVQTMALIPETVPPMLAHLAPPTGTNLAPMALRQIAATFSEPLNPLTLEGPRVRLDLVEGDALTPVPFVLRLAMNDERVEILFEPVPDADVPRVLRLTIAGSVTDTGGNPLGSPVLAEYPLMPVDRLVGGTNWGTAASWSRGLPGPESPVILGAAGAVREVQVNPPFGGQAYSVVAHDSLTLKSSLTVSDVAIFHQRLAFVGQSTLMAGGEVHLRAGGEATGVPGGAAVGAAVVRNEGTFLMNKNSASDPLQILGTTVFRNEAGATLDLRAGEIRMAPGSRLENDGRLVHDAESPALLASARLDNFGRVEVISGRLDLLGGSTHYGVVAVAPGAELLFGSGALYSLPTDGVRHVFTPSSRLEGTGRLVVREAAVHFLGAVDLVGAVDFDSSRGSITFGGATRLRGGLNLSGEFRNPFAGNRIGNEAVFTGLSAQFDAPVVMGTNSSITFDQAVPARLVELDAGSANRLQGKRGFTVEGRARLGTSTLTGAGEVRFVGPTEVTQLTVQGPNAPAAPKIVEFDGVTSFTGTHSFRQTHLRIGSRGTVDITQNGAWRLGASPGSVRMLNLGTLRYLASTRLPVDFPLANQGQFEIAAGEIALPFGTPFSQEAGRTTLRGGILNADAVVRGGVFRMEGGQLAGALAYFGGQLEFPPGLVFPGGLRVSGGILDLPAHALTVKSLVHTNGTLRLGGGTLTAPDGYQGNAPALLTGHGTLEMRGGGSTEVSPGSPLGILAFTGSYSFTPGGRFVVEIGGPTPGVEFDQLRVTDLGVGSSTTLKIQLVGGYSPPLGAEFPIIAVSNGRRAPNEFETVDGLSIAAGRKFEVLYEVTGVKLRVVAAP